jgi:hypothetical protein
MSSSSSLISNKCNSIFRRRVAVVVNHQKSNQAVPNVIDALILQRSKILGDYCNNDSDFPTTTEQTRIENEINHLQKNVTDPPQEEKEEEKKGIAKSQSWTVRSRRYSLASFSSNITVGTTEELLNLLSH